MFSTMVTKITRRLAMFLIQWQVHLQNDSGLEKLQCFSGQSNVSTGKALGEFKLHESTRDKNQIFGESEPASGHGFIFGYFSR